MPNLQLQLSRSRVFFPLIARAGSAWRWFFWRKSSRPTYEVSKCTKRDGEAIHADTRKLSQALIFDSSSFLKLSARQELSSATNFWRRTEQCIWSWNSLCVLSNKEAPKKVAWNSSTNDDASARHKAKEVQSDIISAADRKRDRRGREAKKFLEYQVGVPAGEPWKEKGTKGGKRRRSASSSEKVDSVYRRSRI